MIDIQKSDVVRFLTEPAQWDAAEACKAECAPGGGTAELEKRKYYSIQLRRLQAFGFPVDGGGYASQIAKAATPTRAVAVVWWACMLVENFMRYDIPFRTAAQFLFRLCESFRDRADRSWESQQLINRVFRSLGAPSLLEGGVRVWFENILPAATYVFQALSREDAPNQLRFAGVKRRLTPVPLSPTARRHAACDYCTAGWAEEWLAEALLSFESMGVGREIALEVLDAYFQSLWFNGQRGQADRENCKREAQHFFQALQVPLDEPDSTKFFTTVVSGAMKAVLQARSGSAA